MSVATTTSFSTRQRVDPVVCPKWLEAPLYLPPQPADCSDLHGVEIGHRHVGHVDVVAACTQAPHGHDAEAGAPSWLLPFVVTVTKTIASITYRERPSRASRRFSPTRGQLPPLHRRFSAPIFELECAFSRVTKNPPFRWMRSNSWQGQVAEVEQEQSAGNPPADPCP